MDPSYRSSRRRSMPRLPDFSITPLRTNFETPIDTDHGGHTYSQPHTPRSPRSVFHSPSQTPTVLSRASSRDPGLGRRRKVKSALLLADLERPLAGEDEGPRKSKSSSRLHKIQTNPDKGHTSKSKSLGGPTTPGGRRGSAQSNLNADWLLSTASVLSTTIAESKGQSWLATKSASTSLAGTPRIEREEFTFRPLTKAHDGTADLLDSPASSAPISRRNSAFIPGSRGISRVASRIGSRVGSRANLAGLARRTPGESHPRLDYFSNISVDFADPEEEEDYDSEDELDEYEENELKKLVWGRVGGWVDWAVGWMDWRNELDGLDDDEEEDKENVVPEDDSSKPKRKKRATIKLDEVDTPQADATVPAPPIQAGFAGDAKWLIGVVGKLII